MKRLILESRRDGGGRIMSIDFLEIEKDGQSYLLLHRQCGGMFLEYPFEVRYPDSLINYRDEQGQWRRCKQSEAQEHKVTVIRCRYCRKMLTSKSQELLEVYDPNKIWPGQPQKQTNKKSKEASGMK